METTKFFRLYVGIGTGLGGLIRNFVAIVLKDYTLDGIEIPDAI